jgi:hypothetical protein
MDNRRSWRRLPLMIVWPTTVIIDDESGGGDCGPAAIKHVYAYFITTTEIEPPRTPLAQSTHRSRYRDRTVLKMSTPRNKYTFIFGERFSILNVYVFFVCFVICAPWWYKCVVTLFDDKAAVITVVYFIVNSIDQRFILLAI